MEKVKSSQEAATRLKAKEEEINRRFEALQDEVKQTKEDVFGYVKTNPMLAVCGTTLTGIVVGLLVGGIGKKGRHKEIADNYVRGLSEIARNSGVSEEQVGVMLREALRDTIPQVVYSVPKKKSASLTGKLFGMVTNVVFGYLTRTLMSSLEAQFTSKGAPLEPGTPEDLS